MKTMQSIEISKAMVTLSDFLDITVQDLASIISLMGGDKYKKIKEAIDIFNDFRQSDIIERGKRLGYDIVLYDESGVQNEND